MPKNFYASTKSALEMIINFYALKNKNLKFYNIKFYESFSENDQRKKLIPTLIKNYQNNKETKINSKKLELNIKVRQKNKKTKDLLWIRLQYKIASLSQLIQ